VTRHGDSTAVSGHFADLGKTSIFVTHDPREAMLLATHIALLREGRLEVLEEPANFLRARERKRKLRACLG
jgi:ABC-type proline/glycine betaine transport system ATPase subunit